MPTRIDMADRQKLLKLIDDIHRFKLDREPYFDKLTVEQIEANFNGVGPDWMPTEIRAGLSFYLRFFMPAVVIHDMDFTYLPKLTSQFNKANDRLYKNCRRIVKQKTWWWQFATRKRRYAQCEIIYWACDTFGLQGFMDAKEK